MSSGNASDTFFENYRTNPESKAEILTQAALELSPALLETLQKRIDGYEKKGKAKAKNPAPKTKVVTPETTTGGGEGESEEEEEPQVQMTISDSALIAFWAELEKLDVSTLISEDVIKAFEYQGFNPNVLLSTLMIRGLAAGKTKKEIQKDIVDMTTIAIIKGSITEKNLDKMSDNGKLAYGKFEKDYKLVKGGSKGKASDLITVARVAASMPGIVMQILKTKPALSKQFPGPFGSNGLPYYLRHQAAAACIPSTCPERLKDFLLGMIIAFTADQTKALSKAKPGSEELYDTQMNFVFTTHASMHPIDSTRVKIFKTFSLESDYDKLASVGAKIKKVKSDFIILTLEQISEDVGKM